MVVHGYCNENRFKAFCSKSMVKLDGDKKDQESGVETRDKTSSKRQMNVPEQLKKANYKKANVPEIVSEIPYL